MKISNQKKIFLSIVFLSLFLRLLFIDKQTGFWHNEMVMYNQACESFPFGIIKAAVQSDVHFPLYQIFLAIWMKIFSNNDIVIRLFSVLMGIITIIFAFLTGKEAKDEKTGNIFAFLTAINSVLIFYSQEVKFYIMLAMLTSMSLFFITKIKNKNNLLCNIGYVLSNLAIIYTFTIGILYVFAQFIIFFIYIMKTDKKIIKSFIVSNLILFILSCPFVFYILFNLDKYESASWIFTSNIFTLFVLLQNYFSPALIAVYNNPVIYIPTLALLPVIFIYLPVLIFLYAIYRGIKEDKFARFIFLIPVLFLILEVVLCLHSGLRMLTRYTILAVMPLLFVAAIGISTYKNKIIKTIISILLIINLFFLIAFPTSAVRGYRDLGQKPVADIIMKNGITDDDIIILTLRKNDFDKYLIFNGQKYSMLQDFIYSNYAFDNSKNDKYEAFRDYIFDKDLINKKYEKYILEQIINKMKRGHKIFLIWDESYNLNPFKDKKNYKKYPIMTLSLSKMSADTLKIFVKYLIFKQEFQLIHYKVFIFEK